MRIELAFGKTGLAADLPAGFDYRVLEAKSAKPLAEPVRAIEQGLDHPIASDSLFQLARGKKTAAISVCDITRPAPNKMTLPPIIRRLEAAGVPSSGIRIMIATGLHRPATDAEINEIVGRDIASKYTVINHHAKELSEHTYLGETKSGIPVHIDTRFVKADLHITLGFIEPHLMLGFSGGRKLIAPGLAAQETIKVIHSPKFMRDPRSVESSIEDNPLHKELLEVAAMARHDFMLDVALTRDRKIAGVFAGNAVEAHKAGVRFVSQALLQTIDEPVDAVITTCAGYPLDLTFYQAVKGITAASHIVKPGGRILLVAECSEGPGAPEFCDMLKRFPTDRAFLEHVVTNPVEVDQWQLEKLALVTTEKQLLFYVPKLAAEYQNCLWGTAFPSIDAAVAAVVEGLAPGTRIAVIPEGPYVLARALEAVGAARA